MKKLNRIIALFVLIFFLGSCEKDFLETSPTGQLSSDLMFESIEGANLALNGMYRYLYAFHPGFGWGYGNHDGFGHMAHLLEMDLMGEDMVVHSAGYGWFNAQHRWLTHRNSVAGVTHERWRMPYAVINNANIIILYVDDVEAPTAQKNMIKAQALAARAFAYYHLAAMFSDFTNSSAPAIPLYTLPGQEGHPRSSVGEVFDLIYSDLDQAIAYFDGNNSRPHRSFINLATAHGFYARAALSQGDWALARDHADMAINLHGAGNLFSPGDYPEEFSLIHDDDGNVVGYNFTAMAGFNNAAMSSEWMWGSIINDEHATIYASYMSHMDPRFMTYASLGGQKKITQELYDMIPDTDRRRNLWVPPDLSFVGQYGGYGADIPPLTQMKKLVQVLGAWEADYIYMRLAEMFFIKAEAQSRLGQDADAAQTLYDVVSHRDPAYTLSTSTGSTLRAEIMLHRRIELWAEGHRWIDLKRQGLPLNRPSGPGNHDPGMAGVLEVAAGHNDWNWLIPQDELDANDAIGSGDQNP